MTLEQSRDRYVADRVARMSGQLEPVPEPQYLSRGFECESCHAGIASHEVGKDRYWRICGRCAAALVAIMRTNIE